MPMWVTTPFDLPIPLGLLKVSCGCSTGGNPFHDAVANMLADIVDKGGGIAVTDVPLQSIPLPGGPTYSATADAIVLPAGSPAPFISEVKTGANPQFTPGQSAIYPLAQIGGHVTSSCLEIALLGFDLRMLHSHLLTCW